jgi:hypothetical protein
LLNKKELLNHLNSIVAEVAEIIADTTEEDLLRMRIV